MLSHVVSPLSIVNMYTLCITGSVLRICHALLLSCVYMSPLTVMLCVLYCVVYICHPLPVVVYCYVLLYFVLVTIVDVYITYSLLPRIHLTLFCNHFAIFIIQQFQVLNF